MATGIGAAVSLGRVQGLESDIGDLKLRDGKSFTVAIGGAIQSPPILRRTIEGASSVTVPVYDASLTLLKAALLGEKFDAKIDGLWFRYVGASKSGKQITLTFEDRDVARVREMIGPKKAFARRGQKNELTRAEFVIGLVQELRPKIPWYCPQLHEKQPVETAKQAKRATDEAKVNRSPGLGNVQNLTMDGAPVSRDQLELGEMALQIAASGNAPFRVQVALIEALMAESSMGSASPGNVLQALPPYTQIRPAAEEISGFLFGKPTWTGLSAVKYYQENPGAPAHEIAQAVQKSAFSSGSNYAKFESEAREWVEAFGGGTEAELSVGGGSKEVVEPRTFEVRRGENYWEAIQRLAKEVRWRAFFVAGRFYFIDEIELMRGQVRLAIEAPSEKKPEGTKGIEDVDFDFHLNKPITEATVTAEAKKWGVPPGAVATLRGYGPASLGPGDAPLQRGAKAGLSSAVNASTHEGKGRYLCSEIEVPILGSTGSRKATIKLRKPTAPLKEPANERKTVGGGSASAPGGPAGATTDALDGVRITSTSPGEPWWGGCKPVFEQFIHPFLAERGLQVGSTKEQRSNAGSDHDVDNATAYATDYPTYSGESAARALAEAMGNSSWSSNSYDDFTISVDGHSFRVQILWGSAIDHGDHVHVGLRRE